MFRFVVASALLVTTTTSALHSEPFTADVWADNWFEMRIDGLQVAEDSVPITTERSFNAERFTFDADRPFVIGLVAMDFRENDTGLEYIGTQRQQMGDGGVILQIRDATGALAVVSDADWRCLVIHTAPTDTSCEDEASPIAGEGACRFEAMAEPEGWDNADFDASYWPAATIHSAAAVDPKDGYDDITWDPSAAFIWGPDLERSNTVLCRAVVE
ncbi:PEBP family protein [Gymnodinialimonas sp. 2305UL16-5]|uniref:PEBP family protein n=1 Tax=Gymnodinialimonas mytili TaxID=3126503 RepID=UPI00309C5284